MNKFSSRLQAALKNNKITQSELARKSGIGRNSISDYVKGKYVAKQDKALKIAKVLNVDVDWLMGYDSNNNISNISESDETQKNIAIVTQNMKNLNTDLQQDIVNFSEVQVKKQQDQSYFLPKPVNENSLYEVVLNGYVSASTGKWIIKQRNIETVPVVATPPEFDFVLKVSGDSMSPLFEDKQVIFVKQILDQSKIFSNQIVIAELNGVAYVKKLRIHRNNYRLVSLNKDYEDIIVKKDDNFYVRGIVVLS